MAESETDRNQANKDLVWDFWQDLDRARADRAPAVAANAMAADVAWHGHAPVGSLSGPEAFVAAAWGPLLHAFPDLTRRMHLFFGGRSNGRTDGDLSLDGNHWVTGTGYLDATFVNDYLGIPATGGSVQIRWGEFCRIDEGRIREVYFLVDVVDLMRQAGYDPLPPSRGREGIYPAPAAADGILRDVDRNGDSAYSLDHIRRFIFDGLNAYDESELASMGMADFFDPQVKWYGPGGIGSCLTFSEFEDLHQAPWLLAFPDRQVQDLDALFAEGVFSAAPGWAGVVATNTGPYLGHGPTGRRVEFNGLDWWKREGERYIENWVFVDMVHLFAQMGVDLFDRLHTDC